MVKASIEATVTNWLTSGSDAGEPEGGVPLFVAGSEHGRLILHLLLIFLVKDSTVHRRAQWFNVEILSMAHRHTDGEDRRDAVDGWERRTCW